MYWTVYKELRKPALCGLCRFWLLVLDEIVMCAPHVIGEKMLAQANKELKAGIEVRMLATPTDASKGLGMSEALTVSKMRHYWHTAFLTAPGKRCIYFHTQFKTPHPPKSEPLRQYNRTRCRTPKNGLRL